MLTVRAHLGCWTTIDWSGIKQTKHDPSLLSLVNVFTTNVNVFSLGLHFYIKMQTDSPDPSQLRCRPTDFTCGSMTANATC